MAIHERTNTATTGGGESPLPRDEFSVVLRNMLANPSAVVRTSAIDVTDFYGNITTWHLKTIRTDGAETVFIQRNTPEGGDRMVLPSEVVSALVRQRDGAVTVARRRAASRAAATREAKGIVPHFGRKGGKR